MTSERNSCFGKGDAFKAQRLLGEDIVYGDLGKFGKPCMTGTSPKQPSVVDGFKIEKKGTKPSVVTAEDITEENIAAEEEEEEEEEWLEHDHRECDRIRTEARNNGIFGRLSYPCREVKQVPPPPPPCMAMEEDLLDLDHPTSFPFQPLPLPLSDFTSFSFDPFPRSVEADGTDCFAGCGSNTSAIGGSSKYIEWQLSRSSFIYS